jgi:hypothetical protein
MFYVQESLRERVELSSRIQHKQIDLISEYCLDARTYKDMRWIRTETSSYCTAQICGET